MIRSPRTRASTFLILTQIGTFLAASALVAQTVPGVPSTPADGYERQPALDVLHYEIAIELPAEGAQVVGRTAVLYQAGAQDLTASRLTSARRWSSTV